MFLSKDSCSPLKLFFHEILGYRIETPCRMSLLLLLVCCMDGKFMAENPGSSLVFLYQPFLAAVRMLRAAGLKVGRCFFLFKSFQNVNSMIFRDLGPINIMIEISALGAEWFLGYTCIFHFQLIQACPFPEAQVLHSFQMLFGYRLGVSLSNYNSGNEDI